MSKELEKEIEVLDKEAREALDKLADKREELEREHRATDLAAERQREREEERKAEEEREHRRAVEEARKLGEERLRLEVLAEEQAEALRATLEELLALDPDHRRAVEAAFGEAPEQLWSRTFSRELADWFRGRFKEVVPGIGGDLREGLALPERDALTPKEGESGAFARATDATNE